MSGIQSKLDLPKRRLSMVPAQNFRLARWIVSIASISGGFGSIYSSGIGEQIEERKKYATVSARVSKSS